MLYTLLPAFISTACPMSPMGSRERARLELNSIIMEL